MTRAARSVGVGVALLGLGLIGAAVGADRKPEEILKELEAVAYPEFDRSKANDPDAIQEYLTKRREASERRGELILELYRVSPDHEQVPELMIERWSSMLAEPAEIRKEIDKVLSETKNERLRSEGMFLKARLALVENLEDPDKALAAVDEFIKAAPKDRRVPQLLYMLARSMSNEAHRTALEDRILREYPDSPFVDMIKGERRQREGVGKPFKLEFTEAIKGTTISMADLKGKVVVIDFWATWCGPCVAEMPKMKELYAQYKDQGVEFIGISLDNPETEGGLKELKEFVKDNAIPWPQYYQGKGWDSEFSRSWGINSIPTVFVVDPEGKLHSVDARGRLEEIIPALLKKSGKEAGEE